VELEKEFSGKGYGEGVRRARGKLIQVQEKEKDEMIDKLKDLGNSFLGKFGLSTDMFKFEQREEGGYGMRFEQGGE
jgi:hypothetical protein